MDIFSDIFETVQLKGVFYFSTALAGEFGVTVPSYSNVARFHIAVEGRCYVQVTGHEPIALNPGDVILVPYGAEHVLSDAPKREAPPLETVLQVVGYTGSGHLAVGGQDEDAAKLICGHLNFVEGADHRLLRALPPYILITPSIRARRPWLDEAIRAIVQNVFAGHPGGYAVVKRLSEVMFIEAVAAVADEAPAVAKVLAGFADPQVGKALALVHADPTADWTVVSLAKAVGMSRSRFAERFHALMDCGPMSYVADWRLQRALSLLSSTPRSIGEIARAAGYKSPAAFTRAFTTSLGRSPRDYRRAHGGE